MLFLLTAPFALVGLVLRMRLDDTPVFRSLEHERSVAHAPLRDYRHEVAVLIGIASLNVAAFYMCPVARAVSPPLLVASVAVVG